MTLADVLAALETRAALPPSRAKDCKTSLRYLAHALGHPALEQCPAADACREEATWATALETHFAALTAGGRVISATTRRNTRNNLRVIFRLAAAHSLLQAPLPPLLVRPKRQDFERQQRKTAPYQTTYRNDASRYYQLPQAEWPAEIQAGWRAYQAKCGLRLREITLRTYATNLATYFGYVLHVGGRLPVWEDLFDEVQVRAFVLWHGGRLGRPLSHHGRQVVIIIAAMAKVLGHAHARALADLRNTLPKPAPLHTKRAHWVSLSQLEAVADACLIEGRQPYLTMRQHRHSGGRAASRFQKGVILKLLVRVPLRQRNIRELRLEHNLYKDTQTGYWHLEFRGDELKVGNRGAAVNAYAVDLSTYHREFIPVLEEFLQTHRPKLPGAATSPFLFLTRHGTPYTQSALRQELSSTVAMRTGQRFYPHLIRTIWATEYIEKTRDFTGAAHALGDNVATVLRAYQHILDKDQHAKAKDFLAEALRTG